MPGQKKMTKAQGKAHHLEHLRTLVENTREVERLLTIHEELTGLKPGRRDGVEVLNKSGIVLLVACWEAYVEDLLENAANELAHAPESPGHIPSKVRAALGKRFQAEKDPREMWKLAGNGWRRVVFERAKDLAGRLNTPRATNVDKLFVEAIGLKDLSNSWYWSGMSAENARKKLGSLITRRGSIAHRVKTAKTVRKLSVTSHTDFVYRLAVKSHNRVGKFLTEEIPKATWTQLVYSGAWRTGSV